MLDHWRDRAARERRARRRHSLFVSGLFGAEFAWASGLYAIWWVQVLLFLLLWRITFVFLLTTEDS